MFTEAGAYHAFADPRTGQAWTGDGPVIGEVTYDITSPVAPNAHAVPARSPSTATHGSILNELFGSQESVTGSSYNFLYGNVNGSPYAQNG